MLTSTHRWIDGRRRSRSCRRRRRPAASTSPATSPTASWVLEANGVASHVTGDPAAILALQTNPVHYYQRPDASHLGVDPNATSLSGHGGSVRFGRSDNSRLRLTDHFHWYSPGLDLNDVGFLRQADVIANQVFLGWSEPTPQGIFRELLVPALARGPVGLRRPADALVHGDRGQRQVPEQVGRARGASATTDVVDTRMLRGGPALRSRDFYEAELSLRTDQSRRVSGVPASAATRRARDDDSTAWRLGPSSTSACRTACRSPGRPPTSSCSTTCSTWRPPRTTEATRWVLGRIDQDTWSFTFRVNLSITPGPDAPVLREPVHRHRPLHGIQARRRTRCPGTTRTASTGSARTRSRLRAGGQLLPGHGGRGRALLLLRQPRLRLPGVPLEPRRALGVEARAPRSTWSGRRAARRTPRSGTTRSARTGTRCAEHASDNVFLVKVSYWLSP